MEGGTTIAEAIHKGSAIAVSDGSYKNQFGTSAYVLESDTSDHCVVAVNVVLGDRQTQSPFQSKLAGLYRIVHMVDIIYQAHTVTSSSIQVGCDGLSVITQSFERKWHDLQAVQCADYHMLSTLHGAT